MRCLSRTRRDVPMGVMPALPGLRAEEHSKGFPGGTLGNFKISLMVPITIKVPIHKYC